MSKTVTVIQDGDDLILPLPDDMMDEVGWKIGDTVRWKDNGDGTWSISKVDEQLDLFDEKDEAVLALMKENSELKSTIEHLKHELKDLKDTFDIDDWK
jgi:hypothetical protein